MSKNCQLLAEIAAEVQFIVAENPSIARSSQRHIIVEIANMMISSGLIKDDTENIEAVVALNIEDYLSAFPELEVA